MKKHERKKFSLNVLLLAVCLLPSMLMAQPRTVSGTVTDSSGAPIAGATVVVDGTSAGTTTDELGQYSLSAATNSTLSFTFVGYEPQSVQVPSSGVLDVVLEVRDLIMEDVVVVGYGVQKRINLTGSVANVSSSQIANRPTTNLTSTLSGLAPGVRVTQGSGNPGSESVGIVIRGLGSINGSSPMILVDGAVADMSLINPDDVESISILKDAASAAIYGSRAAAGVVLVTTKKGRKGAPTVTVQGMWAHEKAESFLEFMSDMPTYMEILNSGQRNVNPAETTFFYTQDQIDQWRAANANPNGIYTHPVTGNQVKNKIAFPNTNWAQEIFKPAFFHRYNVSVSGGGENVNYLLSASYQNNPGSLENTAFERYNIRANVESKIGKFLTIGTRTYAIKEFKEPGGVSMTNLYQSWPGVNPKIGGLYGAAEDEAMGVQNNLLKDIAATGGMREYTRINTTWYATADIWKGISVEAKFNYNEYQRNDETHTRDIPLYRFREGTEKPVQNIGNLENATSYRYSYNSMSYTANLFLRYNATFGDHDINAFAGYEQYFIRTTGFNLTTKGLLDWNVVDITSGAEVSDWGGNAKSQLAILSYLGRVNYAYKNRYLFEANFRSDGSSRFAPGYRWGVFPAFSAGWRISEEPFFEPARRVVNNLKLKASWGKLGNQASGYYDWQPVYGKKPTVMNEAVAVGLAQTQMPNELMSWEKTATTNVGFEADFLRSRLSVEFDYFNRLTTDMLVSPNSYFSMGSGITLPKVNSAAMRANGFDLSIGWRDAVKKFRYSIVANVSYSTNKITKYRGKLVYEQDPNTPDINGNPSWRYTNISEASSLASRRIITEGREYNELFMNTIYSGNASYFHRDGSVNPDGGPTDGMIRSKADLDWARAMIAAGYKLNNGQSVNAAGATSLWYGSLLLADNNGDGIYGNNDDRMLMGKSNTPKWVFGLNMSFEWKGIDMSMAWSGRLGSWHEIYQRGVNGSYANQNRNVINANHLDLYYSYDAVASLNDPNYDPSKDPNANWKGKYPRLLRDAGNGVAASSSYYLYNTSFLKLKSLQVGYTLPKKWTKPLKMSSVRVFFSGENLLTIKSKDYPGVDPEFGAGITVYPIMRVLSGGLTITF